MEAVFLSSQNTRLSFAYSNCNFLRKRPSAKLRSYEQEPVLRHFEKATSFFASGSAYCSQFHTMRFDGNQCFFQDYSLSSFLFRRLMIFERDYNSFCKETGEQKVVKATTRISPTCDNYFVQINTTTNGSYFNTKVSFGSDFRL